MATRASDHASIEELFITDLAGITGGKLSLPPGPRPGPRGGHWVTTHGGIVDNGEGGCMDVTTTWVPAGTPEPGAPTGSTES